MLLIRDVDSIVTLDAKRRIDGERIMLGKIQLS